MIGVIQLTHSWKPETRLVVILIEKESKPDNRDGQTKCQSRLKTRTRLVNYSIQTGLYLHFHKITGSTRIYMSGQGNTLVADRRMCVWARCNSCSVSRRRRWRHVEYASTSTTIYKLKRCLLSVASKCCNE